MFFLSFPHSLPFDWTEILSMCLLFCFVIFGMLFVMYEKKKIDNKKTNKTKNKRLFNTIKGNPPPDCVCSETCRVSALA